MYRPSLNSVVASVLFQGWHVGVIIVFLLGDLGGFGFELEAGIGRQKKTSTGGVVDEAVLVENLPSCAAWNFWVQLTEYSKGILRRTFQRVRQTYF